MEDVRERARELAKALQNSGEYRDYERAREKIEDDEQSLQLIGTFHQKQFEYQARQMSGSDLTDDEREELIQLRRVLETKPDVREFLRTEVQFVQMMSDVQRILAEAVAPDMLGAMGEMGDEAADPKTLFTDPQ